MKYNFKKASYEEIEKISQAFCKKHGEQPYGYISDDEYGKIHDHFAKTLSKHGSYSEKIEEASQVDFSACRYTGDPMPVVGIVPRDDLKAKAAIEAGLEAVSSSPRPIGIFFDFHPNYLLVCSPNEVFGTFNENELNNET